MKTLALAVLAASLASPASACRCAGSTVKDLLDHPEKAATAALVRGEAAKLGTLLRVRSSWTDYSSVVMAGGGSSCDLRFDEGRLYLLLSARPIADFRDRKAAPNLCDSALLTTADAETVVAALAGKTGGAGTLGANPSWGWCRKDADCVLSPGVCGGQDATAKKHLKAHDEWVRKTAPAVNCIAPAPQPKAKAACVENFCAVR